MVIIGIYVELSQSTAIATTSLNVSFHREPKFDVLASRRNLVLVFASESECMSCIFTHKIQIKFLEEKLYLIFISAENT